jgi:cysteinyl-tRNA synthetase
MDRVREALARTIPGEPSPSRLVCHREAFEEALSDDLDTPTAFLCLFDWIREARSVRSGVGDRDLRAMLWMIGMTPPPAGARSDMPSASPARRRRS